MTNNSTIKPYSHRTLLEISVGATHTAEILVHIRRSDLGWFNSPDHLADHQSQLFTLIGRQILPKECGEEIETDLASWKRKRAKIGVLVGEKNLVAASGASSTAAAGATGGKGKKKGGAKKGGGKKGKRGGGGKAANNKKGAKAGIKTTLAALTSGKNKKAKIKRDIDVTYLFGDTLQLTYRVEEINTNDSATLLYNDVTSKKGDTKPAAAAAKKDGGSSKGKKRPAVAAKDSASGSTGLATFRQLKKLSKRIVIWVYPFDPANPTAPNPAGGGFPRPEMIPLTSLFAQMDEE